MTTTIQTQSEYRDLPIDWLVESSTNPRQTFDEDAMHELADFVPGNKIGLLCPCPFCGRGCQRACGSRRSAFRRAHKG
jgi:hypothetical protein